MATEHTTQQPTTRDRGMAAVGRDRVAELVLEAWDAFLDQVERTDLDRRTRLPGWRVHEIAVHLGCWPEHRAVADLVHSARTGATGSPPDPDAVNARVTAAHRDAPRAEVLDALRRNRDETARYFAEQPAGLDAAPTLSVAGRLPLLTVLLGQCYELAVHGLDLSAAGGPPVPACALRSGLAAFADVTGALAHSCGVTGGATLATPDGGWRFAADPNGWTVSPVGLGPRAGTSVEAPAALLLEAASGRVNPVAALARRQLKVREIGGLLRLAPIVEVAPGIPGGPILQLAARTLGGAGGVAGRLLRRR